MNHLCGLEVVISPLVEDMPKLKFHWDDPTPVMMEFNRWLLERFGSNPTFYKIGNKIVTNERGRRLLQQIPEGV